jgi:hypothetical protein
MWSYQVHELTGCDDLCSLPEIWEVLPVPCNQIVRSRRIAALDEDIVVCIDRYIQTTYRFDDIARVFNQLQELQS